MALTFQDDHKFSIYKYIAGVDEAGRGPWAGPVVAAAVIFPRGYTHPLINDSKKLTSSQRDALYDEIINDALAYGVGIVDAVTIDNINILQATKLAMKQALAQLKVTPDFLMIDAVRLDDVMVPQLALIKGDALALPIAAASIIAKVTRDRIMIEYYQNDRRFSFDHHKGYGTKKHQQELDRHGPIIGFHRMSYRPIRQYLLK